MDTGTFFHGKNQKFTVKTNQFYTDQPIKARFFVQNGAKMEKVCYISDLPGTGKTHSAKNYINWLQKHGHTVLLAVPTIRLLRQYEKDHENVIPITTDIGLGAISSLKNVLDTNLRGKLIIITHSALFLMSIEMFELCAGMHLIVDEAPEPVKKKMYYNLKRSISSEGVLSKLLQKKRYNENVSSLRIRPGTEKEYRSFMHSPDSEESLLLTETKDLLRMVKNKSNLVVISKMEQSKRDCSYAIAVLIHYKVLSYFKSVVFISAFFEQTLMYHYLKDHYALCNKTSEARLRKIDHRLEHLEIFPLVNYDFVFSKYLRNNNVISHVNDEEKNVASLKCLGEFYKTMTFLEYSNFVLQNDRRFSLSYMDDRVLRVMNNDEKNEYVGERISSRSHGLNNYTDYDAIAIVMALNPTKHERKLLENLFPDYNITEDRLILTLIQNIARTSLRLPDSEDTVRVLVADMVTAQMIKSRLYNKPKIKKHDFFHDYTIIANTVKIEAKEGHFKNGKKKLTEEEKAERKRERERERQRQKRGQ